MKKISLTFATLACCFAAQAQNYKKIFYKDQYIDTGVLQIGIVDAVTTNSEAKFKLKINNTSADYIIYKANESSFTIAGKTAKPDEKPLLIRPNDNDYRVVNVKGDYKKPADYEFILDGLYKINSTAKGTEIPDFKIPASQNEIKAGAFIITLIKTKKETARTDVRFKVKYTGDKAGIFEPNKIAMKMPDGKEYANYHSDRKPQILSNEEWEFEASWKDIPKASGDMQFVEMLILWRDAFKEITPDKIPARTIKIEFDKDITETRNK